MSDKAVPKMTGEEIADKELGSASDALFDDATSGLKGIFRGTVAVTERIHDNSAAFFGAILGNEARVDHTRQLEDEAMDALRSGHLEAANHFLKRDVAYTGWTQGYDDEDTQRLLKEIKAVEELQKHPGMVAQLNQKHSYWTFDDLEKLENKK